jgi:AraC family transcriptional regulator, regulatory protein of adaptative response / methylated-DNA-[protein]-cysteine methyltransferase
MSANSKISSQTLRYGFGESQLGTIIVACSPRGVAALFIGDDRVRLLRDLEQAFASARLSHDQAGLKEIIAKAAALVDAPELGCDFALDPNGSPLELAVWQALRAIPPGETRSYGAIAKSVGATAQDVGAACAANRIAVAIPCHRVVKSDGSISGYRWGVGRKRRLINREGMAADFFGHHVTKAGSLSS